MSRASSSGGPSAAADWAGPPPPSEERRSNVPQHRALGEWLITLRDAGCLGPGVRRASRERTLIDEKRRPQLSTEEANVE